MPWNLDSSRPIYLQIIERVQMDIITGRYQPGDKLPSTIAENREEASFIWDNYYDPEEEINEYELAIFIPEGEDSDLYRKFEEVHYQRAYDLATIRRLLEEAGMEFVTAYDAFTKDAPRPESERIYVVAREKGKSEK